MQSTTQQTDEHWIHRDPTNLLSDKDNNYEPCSDRYYLIGKVRNEDKISITSCIYFNKDTSPNCEEMQDISVDRYEGEENQE